LARQRQQQQQQQQHQQQQQQQQQQHDLTLGQTQLLRQGQTSCLFTGDVYRSTQIENFSACFASQPLAKTCDYVSGEMKLIRDIIPFFTRWMVLEHG
jgi:hypothetical protein